MSDEDIQRILGRMQADIARLTQENQENRAERTWRNRAVMAAVIALAVKWALSGGLTIGL